MQEGNFKYSIYICPENLSPNPAWKKGSIGEKLKEINYFKNVWGLPHFTLTKFTDYTKSVNFENKSELEIKLKTDMEKIVNSLSFPQDSKAKSEILNFKSAKIIKTDHSYFMIFEDIGYFDVIKEKLFSLGYFVKENKYHVTIGEITAIDVNPKFEELKKELNLSISTDNLSESLCLYFENLEWNLSVVKLKEYPVEVIFQKQIR